MRKGRRDSRIKRFFILTGAVLLAVSLLVILLWGVPGWDAKKREETISPFTALQDPDKELFFTLLHTNDEHSALLPRSQVTRYGPGFEGPLAGGSARLAAAVSQLREIKKNQDEPLLLLSAGDFLGGTPYGWLALQGFSPELNVMRQIGYDVITLGNHEFDYGPEVLARYLQAAGYPETGETMALVASNTLFPEDHLLGEMGILQTHLEQLENGLQVGFLGLLGSAAQSVTPDPAPVRFTSPLLAAREGVVALKEEGADVIVALTHAGLSEDLRLARNVPGIDVIVGGHSHSVLEEPVVLEDGTIIAQAGALLSHLGVLELGYDPFSGELRLRNQETGRPYLLALDHQFPLYPALEAYLVQYTEELDRYFQQLTRSTFGSIMDPVAYAAFPLPGEASLQETAFGNFVTDAMRLVVEEKTGAKVDIALQSNGQIRGALIPSTLSGGISIYDLAVSSGLGRGLDGRPGYPLVSVHLKGGDLWRLLEFSSFLAQALDNMYFLQVSGLRFHYSPERAVLFDLPFLNLPVPSLRGVRDVEVFTGDGHQTLQDQRYEPLEGDQLYRVVAGYRLLDSFAEAAKFLPAFLGIVPRDENGLPLEDLRDARITVEGRELKVWESLVEYAASHPVQKESQVPYIPGSYAAVSARILQN